MGIFTTLIFGYALWMFLAAVVSFGTIFLLLFFWVWFWIFPPKECTDWRDRLDEEGQAWWAAFDHQEWVARMNKSGKLR